ncbi:hypothetical protein EMIT0P43_30023 [Pseudomonas jessenii]
MALGEAVLSNRLFFFDPIDPSRNSRILPTASAGVTRYSKNEKPEMLKGQKGEAPTVRREPFEQQSSKG